MEVGEQIKTFEDFIKSYYYADLMEVARKGETSLLMDFIQLTQFNLGLSDELLENPDEVIKAAEIAITNIDLPTEKKNIKARFKGLPEEQRVLVRNIRSKHINKFISVEGTVRQKSDVRPQVTSAKFECPSCGNVINVLQLDEKFKEPNRCGCGRKGKFKLLDKELIDAQGLFLEESAKDLEGGEQPKRMKVLLKGDLVSPLSEKKTNPGSSVRITGSIKEVPIILRTGGQSTKFDLMVDANYVEAMEEDYTNIEITEEDEEEINEIAKEKNVLKKLGQSMAPGIYGHDRIKEAIVLQFCAGTRKVTPDGVSTRGDLHILLIGDPGAGKSQLLKRASIVAPKSRYVSGKGTSGAGLTASVVKDEFLQGWSLEAGALVLANRGILMIDELDKMTKEDRSAMHEGLEQQTISISKANIQATLRCETTVLAAANPKFGRFDPYETIFKQIDLPPTLINRFDLIFTIKDMPDEEKDNKLAHFILNKHKGSSKTGSSESSDDYISTEMLRKYFIYCKQKMKPMLTKAAITELQNYYVKMRSPGTEDAGSMKSVPITARQLEALVRLSEAAAKVRLGNEVTKKDAKMAISLLHYCLEQVGLDPDTGKIDIDRITTGITSSERNKIVVAREIINSLEEKTGHKQISVEDIIEAGSEKGLSEEDIEEAIEKLKRTGDLFEPKRGYISKL
ncbi:MAG: minichromosome maintenance protein MCM [Nanoarchaeota archaeon]